MNKLILKPGRDKSLKRRHPWIFSGAVARIDGSPASGETVEILASSGEFLALAAYSPQSQILARVWDWKRREISARFFEERVAQALDLRLDMTAPALRLIHAESDGLPGTIVDRYAGTVVLQLSSAGAMRWRDAIIEALQNRVQPLAIVERSDADVMALEGLRPSVGVLRGSVKEPVFIEEDSLEFEIDLLGGHKTGFYLDQRVNRARLRTMAHGRDVLDCFCYSGGFALNAVAAGARSVTAVDSSSAAIGLLQRNLARNRMSGVECMEGDVFEVLRKMRDQSRRFDLIILDPPKFAPTAAHVQRAARAYKDINLLAFKLLRPCGLLFTFSCSGGVERGLFQKIVAGAALDAGVEAQIVEYLSASPDHPVALNFPEGEYLKGLLCRIAGGAL